MDTRGAANRADGAGIISEPWRRPGSGKPIFAFFAQAG